MKGYIIARYADDDHVALATGYPSFGRTKHEAWLNHIGNTGLDAVIAINRWTQKGYSPRPVTLSVDPEFQQGREVS